jgi:tetraacyldisaccharide 4'-kinase
VSIGNLTVGGNGKTPFTLFLAARLRQQGLRIGIVSRGYRGTASRSAGLVSDGRKIMMTALEAGDEPVMMAKSFDGPVAVARRRIDAINLLATNGLAEAAVLDDGFQHIRLRRDFDLLVINETVGFGNGRLLPAGPLREPLRAIRRADAIVRLESPGACAVGIDTLLSDYARGMPVLRARFEPSSMTYSDNGRWHERPLMLEGRRVVAVSGIANAVGFHAMVDALGAKVVRAFAYPDHHDYTPDDWNPIVAAAGRADMVVTTEKDLVKLEGFADPQFPLGALRLEIAMEPLEDRRLTTLILERIGRHTMSARCGIQGGKVSGNQSRLA